GYQRAAGAGGGDPVRSGDGAAGPYGSRQRHVAGTHQARPGMPVALAGYQRAGLPSGRAATFQPGHALHHHRRHRAQGDGRQPLGRAGHPEFHHLASAGVVERVPALAVAGDTAIPVALQHARHRRRSGATYRFR
ncbi:hypothetical protein BUY84_13365, partial [Staphylococcus equorum]